MARRTRGTYLTDSWRERIQTSMLINRLSDHAFGKIKLEATQLKAIEILLRKVAPDLAQIDSNVNMTVNPTANVYPIGAEMPKNEAEQPTIN